MPAHFITIEPEGEVTLSIGDPGVAARADFDGDTDVVTLLRNIAPEHPLYSVFWSDEPEESLVGWINDHGVDRGLALNRKAWGLYGRSPVYGPMIVAYDGDGMERMPLSDAFIAAIESVDFPPPAMLDSMDRWLERNGR